MIRVASGDLFGKDLSVDRPDHGIPAGEVAQKAARLLEATANIPMIMQAKNVPGTNPISRGNSKCLGLSAGLVI